MAPVSDVEREGDCSRNLNRDDVLCPICLEIYCEPVTLPCTHTFCKVCFLESVDKATLCCPLCRKRISVWARQHSKSLVNEGLWTRIQSAFPRQRLQEEPYEPAFCPRLSEPGALRREYEDEVSKLSEEKRELDEQENRASEELIQKLLAEEEALLRERRQQDQEDEKLARLLSQELNSVPDADQSPVPEPTVVKKKPTGIDRFLFPLPRSPAHYSPLSNKENVLAPSVPPPLDYYGPPADRSQPPRLHPDQPEPEEPPAERAHISEPRDGAEGGTKRKGLSEGAESQGKRSCQSSLLGVAMDEWEVELQRRRKQEEEDLRVALELQRQLDRQQRVTDRRKGSADAYELRGGRRGRSQTTTAPPPVRKRAPAAAATVTQSSTPNTDSTTEPPNPALPTRETDKQGAKRGQTSPLSSPQTPGTKRQTTLTDLFNLHS